MAEGDAENEGGLLSSRAAHLHWRRKRVQAQEGPTMDPEDLEPRKVKPQPKDLEPLSIGELENYIAELKAEIARVEAKIAAKRSHLGAAAAFFKQS
jgi:uncharacterized small protein (DUF1192 family)